MEYSEINLSPLDAVRRDYMNAHREADWQRKQVERWRTAHSQAEAAGDPKATEYSVNIANAQEAHEAASRQVAEYMVRLERMENPVAIDEVMAEAAVVLPPEAESSRLQAPKRYTTSRRSSLAPKSSEPKSKAEQPPTNKEESPKHTVPSAAPSALNRRGASKPVKESPSPQPSNGNEVEPEQEKLQTAVEQAQTSEDKLPAPSMAETPNASPITNKKPPQTKT